MESKKIYNKLCNIFAINSLVRIEKYHYIVISVPEIADPENNIGTAFLCPVETMSLEETENFIKKGKDAFPILVIPFFLIDEKTQTPKSNRAFKALAAFAHPKIIQQYPIDKIEKCGEVMYEVTRDIQNAIIRLMQRDWLIALEEKFPQPPSLNR